MKKEKPEILDWYTLEELQAMFNAAQLSDTLPPTMTFQEYLQSAK